MALNSTQVVAKAQAETRGNFHSIQVNNLGEHIKWSAIWKTEGIHLQVMLGFQHADLNFPPDFHQHEDVHQQHDLVGAAVPMNTPATWPSCAQQQAGHNLATGSVTSTTSKKGEKSSKKNANDAAVNNATKKKKTRSVLRYLKLIFTLIS